MRRKEVSRRLTSVAEVRTSQQTHRDRVGGKLDQRPAAQIAGMLSQPYFDHMDEELAAIESELVTTEDAHVRNLVRLVQLRREGTALTSEVYDKQTAARQILVGLYGPESDYELAAASGETPRVAQPLAEQVDQTVKLLRDPVAIELAVRLKGVTFELAVVADDLESSRDRLLKSRGEYQQTKKATDGTRILVNAAIEQFDRVFPWVASSLESIFRLAGEHQLADRIRTSRRRVTRRQGTGQEGSQTGDPQPGEATSGEPQPGEATSGEATSGEPSSGEPTTEPAEAPPAAP